MSRNDGGPAFPLPEGQVLHNPEHGFVEAEDHARYHESGMSLRDYFAAKALAPAFPGMSTRDVQYAAEAAYELADAMLAARSA